MNPLTDPDGFFSEKMEQDTNLKSPALIVLVTGVIAAVNAYIIAGMVMEAIAPTLPPEAAGFAKIGSIFGAVAALFITFIMWAIYTGIFFVISAILGGEGDFKRLLAFVGYGFIPTIFGSIITTGLTYYGMSGIEFSMENPELMQQSIMVDPMMQLVSIIGIIFLLWTANICIFAVKHARGLNTKNSLITVGIPIGIYILYQAVMLILMM